MDITVPRNVSSPRINPTPPWLERDRLFEWSDGWTVERLRTPWDMFVEGRILDHRICNPAHIYTVQNGEEYLFSLRNSTGRPEMTMVAIPRGARDWWCYGDLRTLGSEEPITIDNVVMDLVYCAGYKNKVATGYLEHRCRQFYEAYGGGKVKKWPGGIKIVGEEYTTWRKKIDGKVGRILVAGMEVPKKYQKDVDLHVQTKEDLRAALTLWEVGWGLVVAEEELALEAIRIWATYDELLPAEFVPVFKHAEIAKEIQKEFKHIESDYRRHLKSVYVW